MNGGASGATVSGVVPGCAEGDLRENGAALTSAALRESATVRWQRAELTSPNLPGPVAAVVARDIPYLAGGNRFQTLNIYLPDTPATSAMIGQAADALPYCHGPASVRYLVHIHGGAWRDPELTAASIEPTAAHVFSAYDSQSPIAAIISINYRISPFPAHPTMPYDAVRNAHLDPAREARHPDHLSDVLNALAWLRSRGIDDRSYILSGHSCGACLALQVTLSSPANHGLHDSAEVPVPAAVLGLNGLYDLPALVHGLDQSHEHLCGEYEGLLSHAFGPDESVWTAASPALFDHARVDCQLRERGGPWVILLDQSADDQLVPMSQKLKLEANLRKVDGIEVIPGRRCTGEHAAPWERGLMIWDSIKDVSAILAQQSRVGL